MHLYAEYRGDHIFPVRPQSLGVKAIVHRIDSDGDVYVECISQDKYVNMCAPFICVTFARHPVDALAKHHDIHLANDVSTMLVS